MLSCPSWPSAVLPLLRELSRLFGSVLISDLVLLLWPCDTPWGAGVFATTAATCPAVCCRSVQELVLANTPSLVLDHKACVSSLSSCTYCQRIAFVGMDLHESLRIYVCKTTLDASLVWGKQFPACNVPILWGWLVSEIRVGHAHLL